MALGSPRVRVGLLHRHLLRPGLLREARQQEARELHELALEIREPAVFFGRGQPLEWHLWLAMSFFLEYTHNVSLY